MMEILDNVLEEHNAILVDDAVKKLSWKYDYPSEPTKPNKHWHVLCGHNEGECVALLTQPTSLSPLKIFVPGCGI